LTAARHPINNAVCLELKPLFEREILTDCVGIQKKCLNISMDSDKYHLPHLKGRIKRETAL